ncbi:hypothetical protein IHQ71_02350 [Rhizobium sp. TH2]|uniref:hypothetical protein n=1 Tax=Rhizobium sp. TH2 TaxID=2775403 RepID=UPI002157EED5|nr:hypothetical protein [Rhizobium sp. TH2]UVC09486.1 hypothetical protein IHQ71_02350 [Rhizobium sp. TH2]
MLTVMKLIAMTQFTCSLNVDISELDFDDEYIMHTLSIVVVVGMLRRRCRGPLLIGQIFSGGLQQSPFLNDY